MGVAFLGVAVLLLLVGLGLCLWGAYLWLAASLQPAAAAAVIGGASLVFAGAFVWIAMRLGR